MSMAAQPMDISKADATPKRSITQAKTTGAIAENTKLGAISSPTSSP